MSFRSRTFWLKHLHQWHWVSSAVSLVGMIVFAVTGITLNHAADIERAPTVQTFEATVPAEVLAASARPAEAATGDLPPALAAWITGQFAVSLAGRPVEWDGTEAYVSLPRAGGDAWLAVDLETGAVSGEDSDRGWIAYLNDLHKGRNTGAGWRLFIDAFAVASIVFCVTGLVLLQLHAAHRPTTWPLVGLGLVIPLLVIVLLVH